MKLGSFDKGKCHISNANNRFDNKKMNIYQKINLLSFDAN